MIRANDVLVSQFINEIIIRFNHCCSARKSNVFCGFFHNLIIFCLHSFTWCLFKMPHLGFTQMFCRSHVSYAGLTRRLKQLIIVNQSSSSVSFYVEAPESGERRPPRVDM